MILNYNLLVCPVLVVLRVVHMKEIITHYIMIIVIINILIIGDVLYNLNHEYY